jgi:hypothetical protein
MANAADLDFDADLIRGMPAPFATPESGVFLFHISIHRF